MVNIMKFLCRVEEGQIERFFETVDFIKGEILKSTDPVMIETYQAMLGEYEMNLNNVIIERG